MQPAGKYIVIVGVIIVVVGLLVWFAGDKLNWFGNLPGDIKVEKKNVRVYFPFMTMLLLSVLLSLLMWLFRKFF
jgi:H+/Cl- antiporter ClcA